MSISIESDAHRFVVHGDCDGEQAKRREVFLADLFSPGGTMPGDLDPHNFHEVEKPIAGDVIPQAVAAVCMQAQVQIDIR